MIRREWVVAVVAALALALALNWGALADPAHTLPQDIGDPALVSYLIAWDGHALLHEPANLWNINAFYPARYGLAYSDSLLGYAPFAFVGTGPVAAVLRYNLIFILAMALTLFGGYALTRQLGVGRVGATLAGVAVAMAPWRLAQAGHLQILSEGGILLALAMLARGHDIRWRRRDDPAGAASTPAEARIPAAAGSTGPRTYRPGWALAGWLVATWQLSIGFGLGLVFAYVLLGWVVVGVLLWFARRAPLPPRRLLLADGAGAVVFAVVGALLARPYLKVLDLYPNERRDAAWIALYSPPVRGLFTAPHESRIWGGAQASTLTTFPVPGEMALLPGFALYALALFGVFVSVWSLRVRLSLLAGTVVSMVLVLGTNGPHDGEWGYLLLFHLPGFSGLRTPGRLMVWTTILLALLAAGGVCALVERVTGLSHRLGVRRAGLWAQLALLLPAAIVLTEGLGTTPHAAVPPAPAVLSEVQAPYLVLPSNFAIDGLVMLWSTDRFAPVVNGNSGVLPTELAQTREQVRRFPTPDSIAYLRSLGVRTVVVYPDLLPAGSIDPVSLPLDGLGISRTTQDGLVIFTLQP
jgi:hypothetical protein